MVTNYTYNVSNLVITKEVVTSYINMFWDDVYKGLIQENKDTHLMLIMKVYFTDGSMGYRTIGQVRRANYNDKGLYTNYIVNRLGVLNESYRTSEVSSIVFSYMVKGGTAAGSRALLSTPVNKDLKSHRFNNLTLPVSMELADYGVIRTTQAFETFTRYVTQAVTVSGVRVYEIDVSKDNTQNKVTIMGGSELVWTDTKVSEGELAGGFKRVIQKSTIYFLDGVVKLRKAEVPAKPFRKVALDKKIIEYFITMDIETININGKLTPYLICAHNGFKSISSYGLNQKDLFKKFIKQVLKMYPVKVKAQKLLVYAHNLGGFDGVYLLNHLTEFGEVKPLVFNGKLISITLILNIDGPLKGKTIVFKDSFLLLPTALRSLCSVFKVSISKTFFPFHLTDIFYQGPLPELYLWDNTISNAEYHVLYTKFVNKVWCFRTEAIKYCKIDCVALHQVLTKFNEFIFTLFSINAHSALTLPALSMRIFKAVFMPDNTVYQISGEVEQAIRESYTGGAVDVYVPHNKIGTFSLSKVCRKIFAYDVNSLYPAIMASGHIPIGKPIAFEGGIRMVEPEAFGFFYCDIVSPDNLLHPILQRRIQTSEGMRTIAGLGSWTGWLCSAEMDNAMKYGYSFEILKGYHYETSDLFNKFILKLYELRLKYPKGHPMNEIAKLLMNSLYGKFGMKDEITAIDIYKINNQDDQNEFDEMVELYGSSIIDIVNMDENHIMIIRNSMADLSYNEDTGIYHGSDINISI